MKFPFLKSGPLRRIAVVCLLATGLPAHSQVEVLKEVLKSQQETKPAAAETPEATEARLQTWLKEARAAFARINDPDADVALPPGIDPAALTDYRRDLEQITLGINRHLKILAIMPGARKALDEARAEDAAWNGFAEKPPYSIMMIDEMVNQQEALKEKAASFRSSLDLFSRTLAGIQDEARAAEETSRRVSAATEQNSDDAAAKWRLAADRAKSRLLAVRAMFLQSNVALLKDQTATAEIQLALLARKINTARQISDFTDEDLAKITKAAADRQLALRKEIAAVLKREQDAIVAKARMQATLDKLLKTIPEGTPIEQTPDLALARVKMEATETRLDALQHIVETLESLDQLESYVPDAYKNRRVLLQSTDKGARAAALQSLQAARVRLTAWETVIANDLAAVDADIRNQESRANALPADDPRLAPLGDVRVALWDKQAVVQRVTQAVSAQRRLVNRWVEAFEQGVEGKPLTEKLSDATTSGRDYLLGIWNYDLFSYDDTMVIGGIPNTVKRGVPLRQFVIAIVAFLTAYFIASRVKNRLRNAVVRRGRIAEAQANTLSNWLMIVVGFLLAVGTLHFLKIPLTVFAFFGGALAIGLGFGTQTLIKNFISGIIVLFERKIRVGDIVDIGGVSGAITEINTRSSVLRGGDGRETLVPNSLFLENRVTNLTLSNRQVRRMLTVRVALGSSPQAVSALLKEVVERHGLVLKDPAPIITFEDFTDNAHVFAIYYWTEFNAQTDSSVVASDLRFMIEKRFSETGIHFPSTKPEPPAPSEPPEPPAPPEPAA
ncbi:mechanosensitive ion channel [bacterium]|nr:mechanosensitive ion channel [bacterium]